MPPLKEAVAIRHVAFEDLGVFEGVLSDHGFDVRYVEAGVADLAAADPAGAELLIILGGPIGVYEEPIYPFLGDEIRIVAERLKSGKPLLGVCLGAQLIARAAGAKVYPGTGKEIGFIPVTLTAEGQSSCLAALGGAEHMALHWHGDTFDLPAGAVRLASTPVTANQAFSLGPNVLALQFHMEADPRTLETWLIGHTGELNGAKIDIPALRAEIARRGPAVAAAGAKALDLWLGGLKTSN
jgi:GMP synthase (glutamine-hydrolysing)